MLIIKSKLLKKSLQDDFLKRFFSILYKFFEHLEKRKAEGFIVSNKTMIEIFLVHCQGFLE